MRAAIVTISLAVIAGVLIEIIKIQYLTPQPEPQRVPVKESQAGSPKQVSQQSDGQRGTFHISLSQQFSFGLRRALDGTADIGIRYFDEIFVPSSEAGIRDMGPTDMDSVTEVRRPWRLGPLPPPIPYWNSHEKIHAGHVYAVLLGSDGPLALVKVTGIEMNEDARNGAKAVECEFTFRPPGLHFK